jgi:hypothetical protein
MVMNAMNEQEKGKVCRVQGCGKLLIGRSFKICPDCKKELTDLLATRGLSTHPEALKARYSQLLKSGVSVAEYVNQLRDNSNVPAELDPPETDPDSEGDPDPIMHPDLPVSPQPVADASLQAWDALNTKLIEQLERNKKLESNLNVSIEENNNLQGMNKSLREELEKATVKIERTRSQVDPDDLATTVIIPLFKALKAGTDFCVRTGDLVTSAKPFDQDVFKAEMTGLVTHKMEKIHASFVKEACEKTINQIRDNINKNIPELIREAVVKEIGDRLFWAGISKKETEKDEKLAKDRENKRDLLSD